MFKIDKDIVAVSIGENILHAAHLKGIAPHLKVAGVGRESLEGIEPLAWSDKISGIVRSFGVKKPKTFCVIPSNIVTTKNIEIPSLDEEEIRSIIDLQAGRHTPYSREEILIGYVSIGVFQRNYTKVLLIIANRDIIKSRLDACEQAGLRVDKVVFGPECIASFYAQLLNIEANNDPIAIINLDYLTTDFIVEHNRTLATCRNIPIGMKDLISEGENGKARLVEEITKSLEIYNNEDINNPPAKYVLTSDTPISRDLQKTLKEKLNTDVVIMSFEEKVPANAEDQSIRQYRDDDSFAALISAMYFAHEDLQVDLMPEEVRNQRQIEEQGRQVILSGILAMIFLVLICGVFFTKIYFRNLYLEKIKHVYAIDQYLVARLDKFSHRTQIIKDFLSTRMTSLDVLEELYHIIPDEMYLQSVFMDEKGAVNIQGISESMSTVFDVVKELEDSDLFKNVKTRSTIAKKDRGKDAAAFDIVFKLESAPDGPIGEDKPAMDEKGGSQGS